jgi:hypothetical protein
MSVWSIEPSPRGDGPWFVVEDPDLIHAFAPPGVWLPWPRSAPRGQQTRGGWRRASWPAEPVPALDAELPGALQPVSTIEVCESMPIGMRDQVRAVLVDQLHAALCLGRGSEGLVDDDAAHAGAAAAAWVLNELRAAFPGEEWQLPASIVELADIPPTSDALLDALPAHLHTHDRGSLGLAGVGDVPDWLRRLAEAVLRWIAAACTRLADWLRSKAPVADSGDDRPGAGARAEELVGDC